MIEEVCDVCEGKLVAEGKWSIDGGAVRARWKRFDFGRAKSTEYFKKTWGDCRDFILYLSFKARSLQQTILVSKDKNGASIEQAFYKFKEYEDWQSTRDGLRKKKTG